MSSGDPIFNVDPIQRELFNRFVQEARGHSIEEVAGAAANVIVNALRQAHPTRAAAEAAFDELFGKAKTLLSDHYDSTGRKKGIFPYNQTVSAVLVRDWDKINGG